MSKKLTAVAFSLAVGWSCSLDGRDEAITSQDLAAPALAPEAEMLVYERGIVCVTAPCPYYAVVDRDGTTYEVAEIEMLHEVRATQQIAKPADTGFPTTGLVVKGYVEPGSWSPGERGDLLVVEQVLGAPPTYLTYEQPCKGCERFGLIRDDHSQGSAAAVDLTPMKLSAAEERYVRRDLADSRVLVSGWLTGGDTAESVLVVTDIVDTPRLYHVADNGVRCIIAPCPSYTVSDPEGREITRAASVDLVAMQLAPEEAAETQSAVYEGALVRAWALDGSWEPFQTGNVVYVVEAPPLM